MLVAKQESQVVGYVLMTPTDKPHYLGFVSVKDESNYFGKDEPRSVGQLII